LFIDKYIMQDIIRINAFQKSKPAKIRLGTLFSGIGAIEQVLLKLKLKHEIVFACDNGEREIHHTRESIEKLLVDLPENERESFIVDLYSSKGENFMETSYKANYKIKNNRFFQDIRFLNGKKFEGSVDLIVGGSPCQAFSCNGKRGGFEDTRGTLFYEYARIIRESQPKCFIFENVRGMITHDKGRTWETIKNVFKELNYNIYLNKNEKGEESPILNAVDYGIPQNRLRLYVVGIRKDIELLEDFKFPTPIKLTQKVKDYLLDEPIPSKYYLGQKGFEFVTTHPTRAKVGSDIMNCQKATQQFNWNGDFIFEPLDNKKHDAEILKKAYVGVWKNQSGVIRMFTPRECLRLMGFPDTFKIVVKDNIMWRQSGNSIVVNVLEAILKEIIKTGIL
jgi:DNA (cytosine-5)-methyltransferase 1